MCTIIKLGSILAMCSFVAGVGNIVPRDVEPGAYVAICQAPTGFYLREAIVTELVREGLFTLRWRRGSEREKLDIESVEKAVRKPEGRYFNVIKEYWSRGKDRVEFRKVVCSDQATLEREIKMTIQGYAAVHREMEKPSVGEKAWIAKGPHSISLITREGLSMARAYVSVKSLDAAQLGKLAADVAGQVLHQPWSSQRAQLNKLIERQTERVKSRHHFGKWKGRTQINGKQVNRLDVDEDFFRTFSKKTRIVTPQEKRQNKLYLQIMESSSAVDMEIEIDVADGALAAQERMMEAMAVAGMPSYYRKCDPNDPHEQVKVGDVCFKFMPPGLRGTKGKWIIHQIFFCRNNVSVHLRTAFGSDPNKDARLPMIASLIDQRLQALLEPNGKLSTGK